MVGNLATSKKWSLFRSSSRCWTRVSRELTSIVAFTVDLKMSWSSSSTVPVTFVNSPLTLEMPRWRTENWALEWAGSSCQVVDWAWAMDAVRISATANASKDFFIGELLGNFVFRIFEFLGSGDYSRGRVFCRRDAEKGNGKITTDERR